MPWPRERERSIFLFSVTNEPVGVGKGVNQGTSERTNGCDGMEVEYVSCDTPSSANLGAIPVIFMGGTKAPSST